MTIETITRKYVEWRSKYRLAVFSSNDRSPPQAGFTMPLALGMGLIMIIVTASIIGRSQSDRTTTSSQKEIDRSLSVAEAGSVRVRSYLDRHKFLATKNLNNWVGTLDLLPASQGGCGLINFNQARQQAQLFQNGSWIDLDSSNPKKGRYKISDYQYQNGIGKLTITSENATYNSTQNISSSKLSVEIPIGSESANILPPTLWAKTFNLSSTQKITGQIRSISCPLPPLSDADGVAGVEYGNLMTGGQIIADPFTSLPLPKVAPSTAILIPAITNSVQLPRVGFTDLPDANNEYHYLVDIDNLSSGYSIKLQDGDSIKINILSNQKVNLYLKGNIDLAGSKTIGVDPTHSNLRIYGSSQTTKLTIKSNAVITAFIHAPLADARSISATSSLGSGVTGAVWVKSWDSATNANDLPIVQAGNWADLGFNKVEQPPQLSPISYWHRVEN
jgi:hypothetical protein